MQVAGLGFLPDSVLINGYVNVNAGWNGGNATENFWRGAENMEVNETSGSAQWAVAQAGPFRRMDVTGNLQLWDGGYSSGPSSLIAESPAR
ncbi:MAG TPA: hypothetical protein VKT82_15020 [Ktedonobacterales bacterium]|nr:hypothetical protein [Ktedonobacterales bacterium]